MPINLFINFNGTCRDAVTFYAAAFETKPPRFMTFGDMPSDPAHPVPEAERDKILYTELTIAGSRLQFSDVLSGVPYLVGNNMSLTVVTSDEAQLRAWFARLSEGGEVPMPLGKTEWSDCYGLVVDKFGLAWQLSLQKS